MKNKIIFTLMLLATLLVACGEDFTEQTAFGSLKEEALLDAQGVDLKLIAAYSAIDGITDIGGDDAQKSADNWWLDVLSDDAHKGSSDGDQADLYLLETYDWNTANPYLLAKWRTLYAGVGRANAVMDQITKVTEGDFTQQLAEARFLRGYFNFELQKMYGNIPYISEENYTNTEFNQPNPGPIWDQIEADFEHAMNTLPDSQADVGRPTSWAAKSFLGKTHLHQSEWAEALTLLNDVITSGPYTLTAEFVDNFRGSGNTTESVFTIQFLADDGQSYNGNRGGTLNFQGPNGWCCGFYQPSQDLVNAYQTQGGLPLLDTFNQSDVKNDYGLNSYELDADGKVIKDANDNPVPTNYTPHTGPLDPRLDYTVGRRGIDYNGWDVNPGKTWVRAEPVHISGPYLPKKNVYYNGEDANQGTGAWGQQRSGVKYHIMRYSDVLLMAAEAAVETDDIATALDYVNRVRNRAKNMTYVVTKDANDVVINSPNYNIEPYTSFSDKETARKAVRMERRLELAMEGHRLFDIRRWGNGVDLMNAYFVNEARVITSFKNKPKPYQPRHDLLPIPLNAIDLSQNVLEQNPGF